MGRDYPQSNATSPLRVPIGAGQVGEGHGRHEFWPRTRERYSPKVLAATLRDQLLKVQETAKDHFLKKGSAQDVQMTQAARVARDQGLLDRSLCHHGDSPSSRGPEYRASNVVDKARAQPHARAENSSRQGRPRATFQGSRCRNAARPREGPVGSTDALQERTRLHAFAAQHTPLNSTETCPDHHGNAQQEGECGTRMVSKGRPNLSGMFRRSASLAILHLKSFAAIPSLSLVQLGHTNRNIFLSHESQLEIALV